MSTAATSAPPTLRPAITAFLAVAAAALFGACWLAVASSAHVAAVGLGALALVLSAGGALLVAAGRDRAST